MAAAAGNLKDADAQVIIVSFESSQRAAWLQRRVSLPFILALDADRNAYRAFGLARASVSRTYAHPDVVRFYARELLRRRIPDLRRGQDRRQLGGDFVIDRNGMIVLAHPEHGPEDRVSITELLRAVKLAGGGP